MQEKLRIIIGGNVDRERYRQLILSAEEKLDQLAIPYGDIVLWEINTRAKKRFGQCRAMRKGCFSINIAAMLFQAEDRYVEEVILHELLHSCEGCMSHGKRWKAYAEEINLAYGTKISRTSTREQYGLAKQC